MCLPTNRHMLNANHSSKGIMRGEWGHDDLMLMGFSILEFSTDQAKQLRAALLHRAVRQQLTKNLELNASKVSQCLGNGCQLNRHVRSNIPKRPAMRSNSAQP